MGQLTLEIKNIEVTYLDRIILEIPYLSVYQYDRIGIVGKNGSGKTTLLKLMYGDIYPLKGSVSKQIDFGYFEQKEVPETRQADGELLSRLSVPNEDVNHLSGGEQTRLKLAQLFSTYYEGLLIDEPTTHLDSEGIDFLIDELMYYYGSLIIISHDRYLLDQLVTKIWEVEDGHVTEYVGNYSDYESQKQLAHNQHIQAFEQFKKEKQRLIQAADEKMKQAEKVNQANRSMSKKEAKAKANRMFMTKSKDTSQRNIHRQAKAIEQRIDQLGEVKTPEVDRVHHFPQSKILQMHNKYPIMGDRVSLSVDGKRLLTHASFQFPLRKIIAIEGRNGSGKTVLLKHIVSNGDGIVLSPNVSFGVYHQHNYLLEGVQTVLAFMNENSVYAESKVRTVLHSMGFEGNDLQKSVMTLSGGESTRLVLCQLFLGSNNVLILDEPTNFLDIRAIQALESFLHAYEGTVLLVSHDRTFVKRVADHIFKIEEQQIKQVK
ncbi:ABC-F type ribosomal protection protein [Cytobacillus sp. FSL R5-0569]|uniref:Msr family ABC-F type ribosomal protection protein n=1 Tax=Cytobacillus sp. FSL R5-0569 TaxID=2921649 RepID=UPI0030F795A2